VLFRRRPLDLADVLEQEAAARAALQTDREERSLEAVGDRPGLVEDLDLLGVRPDEVEDLVAGGLGVLEQGGERGDGLAAPRGGVDEERSPAGDDLADLPEDRLLARSDPVGKQDGGTAGRGRGRSRNGSGGSTSGPLL
jgi:hypothetical protein